MSEYCTKTIQKMFRNEPNLSLNLEEILDDRFVSIDTSEIGYGREIFSLSVGLARKLLHNCKHEIPDEKQINKILRLKANLEVNGMKNSWPKDSIVINNKSMEIKDGITRLYAVALCSKITGVMMPIKLEG